MRKLIEDFTRRIAARTAELVRASMYPDIARVEGRVLGLAERIDELARRVERIPDATGAVAALGANIERIRRELEFVRHYNSSYLGDGVSLVWLPDDTTMYVNSNDTGGPAALISGGRYEESNFAVFLSFLKADSRVLDIGANLGIYSLRTAQYFRKTAGRITAFEPHPQVAGLFRRSIEHNGLQGQIELRPAALADRAGEAIFHYPPEHIGGGGNPVPAEGWVPVPVRLEVADEVFPDGVFDLVKLDVEGHELSVLRGLRKIIGRSPAIAILFEKLEAALPDDEPQFSLLSEAGLTVYAVEGDAVLRPLDLEGYRAFAGYLLAARAPVVGDALDRRFFDLHWRQLSFVSPPQPQAEDAVSVTAGPGETLFYGPYLFLPKGRYRLSLLGHFEGPVSVAITEQYGVEVRRVVLDPASRSATFEVPYDLRKFECVARAGDATATVGLKGLRLQRF